MVGKDMVCTRSYIGRLREEYLDKVKDRKVRHARVKKLSRDSIPQRGNTRAALNQSASLSLFLSEYACFTSSNSRAFQRNKAGRKLGILPSGAQLLFVKLRQGIVKRVADDRWILRRRRHGRLTT